LPLSLLPHDRNGSRMISRVHRPALRSWLAVGLLAGSCCLLAVLQYRWITEFSKAERERLHEELQSRLNLLARSFNDEISNACLAMIPESYQIDDQGTLAAYAERYKRWKSSHEPLFRRIAVAIPRDIPGGRDVELWNLNLESSQFERAEWPAEWGDARLRGGPGRGPAAPMRSQAPGLIEVPRFGADSVGPGRGEQEWLLAELNLDYVRTALLPELLNKYVSDAGKLNYKAQVVVSSDPAVVIYQSAPDVSPSHNLSTSGADAYVSLLDIQPRRMGFRERLRPARGGRPPDFGEKGGGPMGSPFPMGPDDRPGPPRSFSQGAWRLLVRHHAGSLEALVAQARWRNIAISGGLLLLILATIAVLVRVSRQSQRLAEVQMNFVASVSHELRTPLTVIRTAAFNLRGRLANRPDQVEKYGKLIQEESEKLTALVEQTLRFASAEAGHVIRELERVPMESLIEESLDASRELMKARGIVLEKRFDPNLPPVLADRLALKHALQNILDNAIKYGVGDSRWVGVFAAAVVEKTGPVVEIRVIDHGPGIPEEEQAQIFDPFFRGRRAVSDQLHGTGLGLSLVKSIIEAHGGSIWVHSEPMNRTEFILRIPAAPAELPHEFAHSLG
jgi:signal transduction histidine kinase